MCSYHYYVDGLSNWNNLNKNFPLLQFQSEFYDSPECNKRPLELFKSHDI